jgi:flagellar basal-body rod protein FlgG
MIRALYSAASGMAAQQMSVDNIANNLANANTNGFKMRRTQFQDLLYQSYVQPGAAAGAQTIVPSGLATWPGNTPGIQRNHFLPGQFSAD